MVFAASVQTFGNVVCIYPDITQQLKVTLHAPFPVTRNTLVVWAPDGQKLAVLFTGSVANGQHLAIVDMRDLNALLSNDKCRKCETTFALQSNYYDMEWFADSTRLVLDDDVLHLASREIIPSVSAIRPHPTDPDRYVLQDCMTGHITMQSTVVLKEQKIWTFEYLRDSALVSNPNSKERIWQIELPQRCDSVKFSLSKDNIAIAVFGNVSLAFFYADRGTLLQHYPRIALKRLDEKCQVFGSFVAGICKDNQLHIWSAESHITHAIDPDDHWLFGDKDILCFHHRRETLLYHNHCFTSLAILASAVSVGRNMCLCRDSNLGIYACFDIHSGAMHWQREINAESGKLLNDDTCCVFRLDATQFLICCAKSGVMLQTLDAEEIVSGPPCFQMIPENDLGPKSAAKIN